MKIPGALKKSLPFIVHLMYGQAINAEGVIGQIQKEYFPYIDDGIYVYKNCLSYTESYKVILLWKLCLGEEIFAYGQ